MGFIAQLQAIAEREKASLARELHDELGGLLVSAVMDLGWAEGRVPAPMVELRERLIRVRQSLAAAVDLKRKIIEELHPTLLDNVGLFAALRRYVNNACERVDVICRMQLPTVEPRFSSDASIALFRVVQEALTIVLKHRPVTSADVEIDMSALLFEVRITSDSTPPPLDVDGCDESFHLAAIRHRTESLGGETTLMCPSTGGIRVAASVPFAGPLFEAQASSADGGWFFSKGAT